MLTFFDNRGNFDMKKFIESERIIMSQWEDDTTVKEMNSRDLINRFTLYFGHINDEMKECVDAFNKMKNISNEQKVNKNELISIENEYYKEILDVAMYIASVGNLFIKKINNIDSSLKDDIKGIIINESRNMSIVVNKEINKSYYKELRNCMFEITYNMSKLREKFPQRKWHKEFVPFNNADFINVCKESLEICIKCITIFINLSLCASNNQYYLINELINEKQRKIVNDAIKNRSVKDTEHEKELNTLYFQINC